MIDLHSREVVGHAMADHMRAELVRDALDLAVKRGLISDDQLNPPNTALGRSPTPAGPPE